MPDSTTLHVNGRACTVRAAADTPLLYVLRNELGLRGPRFGCGLAQCGACTVLLDGVAVRSCVYPAAAVGTGAITTLDGLAGGAGAELHPVQRAFVGEQATQCGYCLNGWIMTSVALLRANPRATEPEIRAGLSGLKCRCGAHMSMLRAVVRAARELQEAGA